MINNLISFGVIINELNNEILSKIKKLSQQINNNFDNYEIVLLINSNFVDDFSRLKETIKDYDIKNVIIFNVYEKLDTFSAEWMIADNSVGEKLILLDIQLNDLSNFIDIVNKKEVTDFYFIEDNKNQKETIFYKLFKGIFRLFSKTLVDNKLGNFTFPVKIINRKYINEISSLNAPDEYMFKDIIFRTSNKSNNQIVRNMTLDIDQKKKKKLRSAFFNGTGFLLSASFKPIRIIGIFSIGASFLSLFYTFWIVYVYFTRDFVEGWVSTNFIISLFFFIISTMLFLLSEYVIVFFQKSQKNYDIKSEFIIRDIYRDFDLNFKKFNE